MKFVSKVHKIKKYLYKWAWLTLCKTKINLKRGSSICRINWRYSRRNILQTNLRTVVEILAPSNSIVDVTSKCRAQFAYYFVVKSV